MFLGIATGVGREVAILIIKICITVATIRIDTGIEYDDGILQPFFRFLVFIIFDLLFTLQEINPKIIITNLLIIVAIISNFKSQISNI